MEIGGDRPEPLGLLFVAAFSQSASLIARAFARVEEKFGAVVLTSSPFAFTETTYYARSMGPDLTKQFAAFGPPVRVDALPSIKRQAIRWERELATTDSTVDRPINLDPGILNDAKVVLASTKDHAHRLYLGQGIFGEITLRYHRGDWRANPWTYPDYQRAEVLAFFRDARERWRERNRSAFEEAKDRASAD